MIQRDRIIQEWVYFIFTVPVFKYISIVYYNDTIVVYKEDYYYG